MKFDKIEYSVCQDCLLYIANDDVPEDREREEFEAAVQREVGDKEGAHFVCGVEPTEDDPEGYGEETFSRHECELCRNGLAGSRHGATLLIPLPEEKAEHVDGPCPECGQWSCNGECTGHGQMGD